MLGCSIAHQLSLGLKTPSRRHRCQPFEHTCEIWCASQAMVLSNPMDIRLPPVKIGDDVPPSARGVMRSLADLVNQCTAIQPDARPTFAEILEARLRQLHQIASG